ncbi:MAG: CBS domain-containing protein [Betaproteobacteria bacterium]|jgi:CBS domain-containing protein|nr:CBS domain-containing protein [Pseudomonadota bacterium]NBO03825.1 CBS domain-containing protein [Betaproteobacteria bacterium]NBO94750.1 CBS domain-containing protein [Betaproteobacteria bacterium]NBP34631.1 CBS domain-containing protein [Betaproteobacteria bacterium]NBP38050.1 CBS domain-containing protein [Betaproteobacteria bacterium]
MNTVKEFLASRTKALMTTSEETPVNQAVSMMVADNIHSLIVMKDDQMVGIFTDRDYVHKIVAIQRDPAELTVGDVMTKDVTTVSPDASIQDCIELMNAGKFRHLPVSEAGRVIGMISMTDVMRLLIDFHDQDIETYF